MADIGKITGMDIANIGKVGGIALSSVANVSGIVNATFLPSDISGLVCWLDATDVTTITQSEGSLTEWRDKSTSGFVFQVGTGSVSYTASGFGGNSTAYVSVAGSSNLKSTTNLTLTNSDGQCTVISVQDRGGTRSMWGLGDNGTGHMYSQYMSASVNPGKECIGYYGYNVYGDFTPSNPGIISSIKASGRADNLTWYNNESSYSNINSESSTPSISAGRIYVFSDSAGEHVNTYGKMGAVLIYDAVLSETDLLKVVRYLNAKFSLYS